MVVCFGEVLWDVFPNKVLLGGAPLNVAMRLHSLGAKVQMISSVGDDEFGKEAVSQILDHGLSVSGIHISESKPTGTVQVSLTKGIASYSISEDVAWDHIIISEDNRLKISNADALVFGSLALRTDHNSNLLKELLESTRFAIFDLNLRPPYYSDDLLKELMQRADLIKMNDEELNYVCAILNIEDESLDERIHQIAERTYSDSICVTLGPEGAILFQNKTITRHPGFKVNVSDTVGAGDSFFAGLIYELLSGSGPGEALSTGCALGALVASKEGANCEVTSEEITRLMQPDTL
ncbi:MAG: carbohydrate kinase [Bacteroidia bacterium]|nr:carbohydrate kinase [Bacteroidia bacterium]NNF31656.1 carbohydrate kinase [Flavobacteriaceae bacterium]MBT8276712.1 carbohydrate kinase [Bacteroidia bacterium]NNJ83160.1 carbohydrate kinase [Flavobacteriaceae bacterium]NNK55170.1 carbohydrate kinase [Flavobacteriaceae bacterium]